METGLVGLRAELQKKRDEVSQHGAAGRGRAAAAARPNTFTSSNPGVSVRAAKDEAHHLQEQKTEDKARQMLERKAAMYDRLNQGTEALEDDTLNQRFLVNFQRKIVEDVLEKKAAREGKERARADKQKHREAAQPDTYSAKDDEDEWVEYTDTFGRTRQCLRGELQERLEQDKHLSRDLHPTEQETETPLDPRRLETLHREAQQHKWRVEEEANAAKKNLHYQDVLYDEARMHGPGYLKFSRDETERKAQMELLRDLRTETQLAEASTAAAATKRQKAMKARLDKVRQRKRLKMGLPVKDDSLKTPPGSDEEPEEEKDSTQDKPLTPPSPPARKKMDQVREWDLGKEGVPSVRNTLTQEEWVLSQRSQRSQEFAPPSIYHLNDRTEGKKHLYQSQTNYNESVSLELESGELRKNEFAPPSTYHSQEHRKQSTRYSQQNQPIVNEMDFPSQHTGSKEVFRDNVAPPPFSYHHREDGMQEAKYSQATESESSYTRTEDRRPEFAPPATHEYYGPGTTKHRKYKHTPVSSVEEAITKGLSYLRKMNN